MPAVLCCALSVLCCVPRCAALLCVLGVLVRGHQSAIELRDLCSFSLVFFFFRKGEFV